jgi:ribosomal protein S20
MSDDNKEVQVPEDNENISAKQKKLEQQRKRLLDNISVGDFKNTFTRVAHILNLYPNTRDSDIRLSIQYWKTFQPDLYSDHGITPINLFKLERTTIITRARAKIQNELKLFNAKEEVKRRRKKIETEIQDEVISKNPATKLISIFADETGKQGDFLIVSSVWVLSGRAVFEISNAIDNWRKNHPYWSNNSREMHFARLGKRDAESLTEYLDVIKSKREFISFKVVSVENSLLSRSSEEAILKLHEYMIMDGIKHELESNRVSLPQNLNIVIDHEDSLDALTLSDLKRKLNHYFSDIYGNEVTIGSLKAVPSTTSVLVQLSDMIAGAVNRKLNYKGERNFKDDYADAIIETLDISLDDTKAIDSFVNIQI